MKMIKFRKQKTTITKSQAKEFYRDLCGVVYGDCNTSHQGIISMTFIAELMKIPVKTATEFCNAMIQYGITKRSCGMIIV